MITDRRFDACFYGHDAVGNYKFFDNEAQDFFTIERWALLGQSILVFGQRYSLRKSGRSYLVEGSV